MFNHSLLDRPLLEFKQSESKDDVVMDIEEDRNQRINDLVSRTKKIIKILEALKEIDNDDIRRIGNRMDEPYPSSYYLCFKQTIRCFGFLSFIASIVCLIETVLCKEEGSTEKAETLLLFTLIFTSFTVVAGYKAAQSTICSWEVPASDLILYLQEHEGNQVNHLLVDLDVDSHAHTLPKLISLLKQKKIDLLFSKNNPKCKMAFLMADHPRLGNESLVHSSYFKSPLYEEKLNPIIFQMAGFIDISIKKEKVRQLIYFSLFENNDHETALTKESQKENITDMILGYSNFK